MSSSYHIEDEDGREQAERDEDPLLPNRVDDEDEETGWRLGGRLALGVFMAVNFLSYYDRGAVAGALTEIKKDSHFVKSNGEELSDAKAGMIVSAFMMGFMVLSPIFASLGGVVKPPYIVVTGLATWVVACLLTSMSNTYWMLVCSRCLIGVGEAAYCGFIPTMIDDIAPKEKRTLWIGLYFAMIPVGMAAGMASGGVLSSSSGFWGLSGWQTVFLTELFPMVPLAVILLKLPGELGRGTHSPTNRGTKLQTVNCDDPDSFSDYQSAAPAPYPSGLTALRSLVTNPLFMLTCLGYAMYTFVIGGISAWGIVYLQQGPLHMGSAAASMCFGGITAVAGLGGTAAGGWFVDSLGGSKGHEGMIKCHRFNIANVALSIPAGIVAFLMKVRGLFFPICFISEVALFATTAPINSVVLETVPPEMRAYAMAFSIFIIHAAGDFPSPLLIGAVSDARGSGCGSHRNEEDCNADIKNSCSWADDTCRNETQLRDAMLLVFAMLTLAPILWLIALRLTMKRRDDAARCE
eukprot:TRINITY_DN13760_c0_g1_i1.p1 TRINITY_DN13760_c0_g1~~TRINITY_DN13760_c0_g1_i1.p1  ORF type:complete len:555 (+),score=80.63 TRINITY_DN13760_c0_g1_i1:105-1667(+)